MDNRQDWRWQLANRITTAGELEKIISLSAEEKEDIEKCLGSFRMAVTPYYASLMDRYDRNCPIRLQAVPSLKETVRDKSDLDDPLGEVHFNPVPNVVRRYPDRALFIVTVQCGSYCRHCTRRRIVGSDECSVVGRKEIECATSCGSHIIPVNLNCSFKMPASLPESIIGHFSRHQFSDLMMSSLFESSMDKMITERIAPIVGKGILHRNSKRKWCIALSVVLVVVICLSGYFFFKRSNAKAQADICSELVERASALTQIPDSLFSAQKCISEAESIVASYSNSLFRDMFPSEVEKVSYRVKYVRDSIFDKYQSWSDEYFDKTTGDYCSGEQGANAFAIIAKLGDERTRKNLDRRYSQIKAFDTGIFATKYLPKTLFDLGYSDTAIELYTSTDKVSFNSWIKDGATTLYESWLDTRSLNHPMFGSVVEYLFTDVLGIKQVGCKYKKIIISPKKIKILQRVSGSILTVSGRISVSYKKIDGNVIFEINVPNGVDAQFNYGENVIALKGGTNTINIKE